MTCGRPMVYDGIGNGWYGYMVAKDGNAIVHVYPKRVYFESGIPENDPMTHLLRYCGQGEMDDSAICNI